MGLEGVFGHELLCNLAGKRRLHSALDIKRRQLPNLSLIICVQLTFFLGKRGGFRIRLG